MTNREKLIRKVEMILEICYYDGSVKVKGLDIMKEIIRNFICKIPVIRGIFKRLNKLERVTNKLERVIKKYDFILKGNEEELKKIKKNYDILQNQILTIVEENSKQYNLLKKQMELLDQSVLETRDSQNIKIREINNAIESANRNYNRQLYYFYFAGLEPERYAGALSDWYNRAMNAHININHPITFNEKIQWMKLYDSTSLKTKLTDKGKARVWVTDKIGEKYLIPSLGIYRDFSDINFDEMPYQFVMKATHGSGWNIIVEDKSNFDINNAKKLFNYWLHKNYAFIQGLELHYKDIEPMILLEEYRPCLYEYQFWCFNEVPRFVSVISKPHGANKKATYDLNWNRLKFVTSLPKLEMELDRPEKFDEMIELSKILCKGFAFVRVDFLYNNGQIFFNELTFTPGSGTIKWDPPEYDEYWGQILKLPNLI